MLKVTYFHTLYQRNTSCYTDKVTFKDDGRAYFQPTIGGGVAIEVEYLRSIEMTED